MEIYPILNKPGKGKYVFIFILNERAVLNSCPTDNVDTILERDKPCIHPACYSLNK